MLLTVTYNIKLTCLSLGALISSIHKTDQFSIIEILLKVVLNTNNVQSNIFKY